VKVEKLTRGRVTGIFLPFRRRSQQGAAALRPNHLQPSIISRVY